MPELKTFWSSVSALVSAPGIEMLSSVVFECVLPVNSMTNSVLAFQYSPAPPESQFTGPLYICALFVSRANHVPLMLAPDTGAAGQLAYRLFAYTSLKVRLEAAGQVPPLELVIAWEAPARRLNVLRRTKVHRARLPSAW